MRISTNMRHEQALRGLQANIAQLTKLQEQVASGKRFSRASEDPAAAARVMRSDGALRGIEQYRRNLTSVRARVDAEEAVLGQVTDLLTRAKELGVQESNATSSSQTRIGAAAELDRIIEQVVQLGNTKVGREYLFGGHLTNTPPFQLDGTYVGDDGARRAEITEGYVVETNHTGRQLLVNSGVLGALTSLRDQLRNGTPASVGSTLSGIDTAFDATQVLLAETGARSRQIDVAAENLAASESSVLNAKDADQGIDLEVATTRLLSMQTSLEAAMLSTSRVLNLSLTEYLR